jgi:hypothetical protein
MAQKKLLYNIMLMHTFNQSELYQKVSMYLDNALSKEEERILLQAIQSNPSYLEMLSKEQNFRDFVKSRIQRRSASPHLVQSIKEKIRIAPA